MTPLRLSAATSPVFREILPNRPTWIASMSASRRWAESMSCSLMPVSAQLKDRRIRSNVVSPGPVKTPIIDLQPPEIIARIVSTIPMGRMGEADEVAKAALFLASDDSSFITGIELFVDGGRAQI